MEKRSFVFGVPVVDYNFTGREEEIRRLLADFHNGINVILMSPRRLGKTSLVKHTLAQVNREEILVVFVDIFGCKSEYEVYNKLAAAVLQQTSSKQMQWLEEAKEFIYRLTPKISISPDPLSEVSVSLGITPKTHTPEEVLSLPQKIAEKKGKRVLVCIDEFQQIGELPSSTQIQARMRTVWQHQTGVSYCLFGSKHHLMANIFLGKSMPFYQFGDLINLKKIPVADWQQYICTHFADGRRTVTMEQSRRIAELVDCYSAYVQQLSWIIYSHSREGDTISDTQIDQGFRELLEVNDVLFLQAVEPLSEYQMNFLRAIVSGVHDKFTLSETRNQYHLGSYSNIPRLKLALGNADLIETRPEGVFITDPVFAKWFEWKMM
ncbi:MAG: AAA family ATPase [Prevotella sp.]|jgi:hypothetical protein